MQIIHVFSCHVTMHLTVTNDQLAHPCSQVRVVPVRMNNHLYVVPAKPNMLTRLIRRLFVHVVSIFL